MDDFIKNEVLNGFSDVHELCFTLLGYLFNSIFVVDEVSNSVEEKVIYGALFQIFGENGIDYWHLFVIK